MKKRKVSAAACLFICEHCNEFLRSKSPKIARFYPVVG
jgi:hypothetical protein